MGMVASTKPQSATPLREAVECRVREGLPNALAKWRAGNEVRVAYLGGSITEANGWRPKTMAWFASHFPNAKSVEINAAIGGTGSDLGVFRLKQDVLDHKPDLLFVEFAVNDSGAPEDRIRKGIEGIVRQTWHANPRTDICFVYTLTEGMLGDLEAGKCPRAAGVMEEVADHYGIPSIHLGVEVARMHHDGKLLFTGPLPQTDSERAALDGRIVFSGDGVHPYPETGHEIYLQCIQRGFAQIEASPTKPFRHRMGSPLVMDNWERARLVPISRSMLSSGWKHLDPGTDDIAKRFVARMPDLWQAGRPGETLTFRFKGTTASIYDLLGPNCGQVSVQVDDGKPFTTPRFDAYCTYHRLAALPIAEGLPDRVHTVTIRILPDQPDKLQILHQRRENASITSLDPKIYDGTNWYMGSIMVLGDVVG